MRKHTSEGSSLALKPGADVTRSPKEGYQWPHKKDSCPPKNFKKKHNHNFCVLKYYDSFTNTETDSNPCPGSCPKKLEQSLLTDKYLSPYYVQCEYFYIVKLQP